MKRTTLAVVVAAALLMFAGGRAQATDGRFSAASRPRPSVFPQPQDPWRTWGQPRGEFHDGDRWHRGGPPAHAVFIPGYWAWNGFQWVWVPGYWRW